MRSEDISSFSWQDEKIDLWWLVIYQYNLHVFDDSSSPTPVKTALHQCARDHTENFIYASQVAWQSVYMDNLSTSLESKDDALLLKSGLTDLLAGDGFNLTKWSTSFDDEAEREKAIFGLDWENNADTLKARYLISEGCPMVT